MDISQKILSDVTVFNKYAKYVPQLKRRENWEDLCERNKNMHLQKYPMLKKEINEVYELVLEKKVLPSMRSMQFAGRPIELANNRMFNCAYVAADNPAVFWETMFLLLGGSGVGYSVQKQHVNQLPVVKGPTGKQRRFLVGDSIEGWADAVKVLVCAYFEGKSDPLFDYRDIRKKGAKLITSGGKAPGPDPLRLCVDHLRSILNDAIGRQLTPIEVHDMQCRIADAVLAGGIRRAAMISLFSEDDMDMLTSKSTDLNGDPWYVKNPQRGRANNSVVLKRGTITETDFKELWKQVERSNAGEPGMFWTNDYDVGTNPCAEISLVSCQFCNVTETNVDDVEDQADLNRRVKAASFLGTLQAGYTDFHYLRSKWRENTERDALIGVGMTGIGSNRIAHLDLVEAARVVVEENARVAAIIGINVAARCTTIKPSGTTSLVVGSGSGIHAWHNDFYLRRMRVGKNEALYFYMIKNFPELVEDCKFKPHIEAVMTFPQKAPVGSILRTEAPLDLLERVKRYNLEWVNNGYRNGANQHNVSCTISVKEDEWEMVGQWMWDNQEHYTGISVLPYDNGSYVQAPFEDCTEEEFERLSVHLHNINLDEVNEDDDNTNLSDQAACGGNGCAI